MAHGSDKLTQANVLFWRPKSLYQLMVIGFLILWLPLTLGIAYTGYRFDDQAAKGNRLAEHLVLLTRANQQLQDAALELERRAGQYVVLKDQDVLSLYQNEHKRLIQQLNELQQSLPQEMHFSLLAIKDVLAKLQLAVMAPEALFNAERINALFKELQKLVSEFDRDSAGTVDQQLLSAVDSAAQNRSILLLMILGLSVVSLLGAWFLIRSIHRPVRQMENEIQRLGGGDLSLPIRIQGPDEMLRLAQQLDWLRIRLGQIDEQKQQFLRHMSHELKTPLASLREGTDLLAEEVTGPLLQAQREILDIVRQNGFELQRLIENLLDYNQLSEQQNLAREACNLSQLLEELLTPYAISISRKSLRLIVEPAEIQVFQLDRPKVRTILDNLISNAVNYSPVGGEIYIHWSLQQSLLQLDVANQGGPIEEDERQRIFEPFFQGSQSRQGAIKGSGIGLAVARECAQIHQGELSLVEDDRYPVCFRLILPVSL